MSIITKLEIDNFMRLKAVRITPDGNAVVLGGKNGAGKTSVLCAIEALMGGEKHSPGEPIRKGAKDSKVVLETETFKAVRKYTAKGSKLEVTSKEGAKYPSPQSMLNELVGKLSFDPFAFSRMKGPEQAEQLRKVLGLDFSKEDAKRKETFDKRTDVNREVKRLQGALDKLPQVAGDAPDAEVSVADLTVELERRQTINAAHDKEREDLERMRKRALETKAEIERLEEELATARSLFEDLNKIGKALAEKVKGHVWADVDEVRKQIATAEETNRAVRAKAERAKLEAEWQAAVDKSEQLTAYIDQIDKVKAEAIAAAKLPIPGLAFTDEGVTLDGIPFDQASHAQRLRTSIAIGLASNPELKVLLVRDGAYLDADGLKLVAQMAEEAGAQVWVEVVGDREGVTVVIEDGEVAEDRTGKGAA